MERGHLLSMSRIKFVSILSSLTLTDCIRYTVIDEADEMVSPDWLDEMRKIMSGGGEVI